MAKSEKKKRRLKRKVEKRKKLVNHQNALPVEITKRSAEVIIIILYL